MISSWLVSLLLFVAGLLIIATTFKRAILSNGSSSKNKLEKYWAREQAASFARRKELPSSLFIEIDFSIYPILEDPECTAFYNKILLFKERPLVHLKGKSNIELKELYGSMQLEQLSYYEQNLIEYMNTSCAYGKCLYEKGYIKEAQKVLEYIISLNCDLSQCFLILSDLYKKLGEETKLLTLKYLAKRNMETSPYLNKVLEGIETQITDLHESEMLY